MSLSNEWQLINIHINSSRFRPPPPGIVHSPGRGRLHLQPAFRLASLKSYGLAGTHVSLFWYRVHLNLIRYKCSTQMLNSGSTRKFFPVPVLREGVLCVQYRKDRFLFPFTGASRPMTWPPKAGSVWFPGPVKA